MRHRQNNSDTYHTNDSDTDKKDWTLTVTRTYTGTDTDTHARPSASNPHHRGPSKNVNFHVCDNSECAGPTFQKWKMDDNLSLYSKPCLLKVLDSAYQLESMFTLSSITIENLGGQLLSEKKFYDSFVNDDQ